MFHLNFSLTPRYEQHGPADLLVDGFIARTFTSRDADRYFKILLREPPSENFLQYYGISHHQGAWYITDINNLNNLFYIPRWASHLLDYSVTENGSVVPQTRWTPASVLDIKQYVENVELQLPIFFLNLNGGIGFRLSDISEGYARDLHNANDPAPLGQRTTTHIQICVSLSPIY